MHSYEVDYAELLPSMFKINVCTFLLICLRRLPLDKLHVLIMNQQAGYFPIQAASEKNKPYVYELIGKHIRKDADGAKQVAFVGVIDPLNPTVETTEQVTADLELAAKYIDKTQLGASTYSLSSSCSLIIDEFTSCLSAVDCRFSPFPIDVKPKHGSPDFARDIAVSESISHDVSEYHHLNVNRYAVDSKDYIAGQRCQTCGGEAYLNYSVTSFACLPLVEFSLVTTTLYDTLSNKIHS